MIELNGVSKRYGRVLALDRLTAHIARGETVGLLGPNGAGKTTLMNIVTGQLAATSGAVSVGGFDIIRSPEEAKALIGYLPEQAPLYDEMTVRDYLLFLCRLRGVVPAERDRHIADISRLTGIEAVLPRRIGNLSRGFKQRVGLCQALCGDPEVLILDEPTAGLDPLQAAEFRQLIKSLQQDHTVLLSSHILADMEQICRRVLILRDGKLLRDYAPGNGEEGLLQVEARIALGKDQLEKQLSRLPGLSSFTILKSDTPGITDALLMAQKDVPVERLLFEQMAALNAPILRLTRRRSTLEEVFLAAMKE